MEYENEVKKWWHLSSNYTCMDKAKREGERGAVSERGLGEGSSIWWEEIEVVGKGRLNI